METFQTEDSFGLEDLLHTNRFLCKRLNVDWGSGLHEPGAQVSCKVPVNRTRRFGESSSGTSLLLPLEFKFVTVLTIKDSTFSCIEVRFLLTKI